MIITARTPWIVPTEPEDALDLALSDLARDWRTVFARQPLRIAEHPGIEADALVVIGRDAVSAAAGELQSLAPEQFVLEARTVTVDGTQRQAMCAYGGDTRGDLYALYALSEHILGVDPFWFWTDHQAPRRREVTVADDFAIVSAPPRFLYRGWFMNDEDLMTGWAPDRFATAGIDSQVWDRLFETILRCKGNMVVAGTFVNPTEPQLDLAAKRGLVIAQHHVEVLGLNVFRWPDEKVYSYTSEPETLERAWEDCVIAAGTRETLWSVGYRGRHDHPFWVDDASAAPTAEERGTVISTAVAKQVEIIRRHRPHDDILMNLWMEGVELWKEGHIQVPEGVMIVWPDDGHGIVLDGGFAAEGHGIYYHTAMYDGIGSQLSEAVPVKLIASEMERMAHAQAVSHVLANVSDVRPCVMTTAAIMELAWGPVPDIDVFYERWAARQYGVEFSETVGALWRRYFDSPWHYAPDLSDRLEDNAYHTYARAFLVRAAFMRTHEVFDFDDALLHVPEAFVRLGTMSGADFARFMAAGTASVQEGWDTLLNDAEVVVDALPADRREFFRGHLITQVAIHKHSNALLHHVATVAAHIDTRERVELSSSLSRAIHEGEALLDRLHDAEYGRWVDWYGGEMFVGVSETMKLLRVLKRRIDAGSWPLDESEAALMAPFWTQYSRIKAYQVTR